MHKKMMFLWILLGCYMPIAPSFYRKQGASISTKAAQFFKPYAARIAQKASMAQHDAAKITSSHFYREMFEPLYVGNKMKTWQKQMQDVLDSTLADHHDKFALYDYNAWLSTLSVQDQEKYRLDLQAYQTAYMHYKKNPQDLDRLRNLIQHTQNIRRIMNERPASIKEQLYEKIMNGRYGY